LKSGWKYDNLIALNAEDGLGRPGHTDLSEDCPSQAGGLKTGHEPDEYIQGYKI
jgi:hypothetical protein